MFKQMQKQIDDIRNSPFRIPVLPADPATTDPTNMWMLPDGRIRARHRNPADSAWVIREWVTTTPGSPTSAAAPAPPTVAPVSRQGTWVATWTASYRGAGPKRTDSGLTRVYWGSSGDSFNGRNRSYIGFDAATIAAALAGGTVTRVRLVMQALHTYWNNGAGIGFGYHNQTSAPGSWAGTVASFVSSQRIGKTELKTFDLPLGFGTTIRDGTATGIAVEAPNSSTDYYGYAGGVGEGVTVPTLIIDYAK